jgi:LysM repeat protein
MNTPNSKRYEVSRARERQLARQRRKDNASTLMGDADLREKLSRIKPPENARHMGERLTGLTQDVFWYVTHTRAVMLGVAALIGVLVLIFIGTHVLSGRIFPNVWSMGVPIGGLNVERAAIALEDHWNTAVAIRLVDQGREWTATPDDLGLTLDALATAQAARSAGMAGLPFGFGVKPVITVDRTVASNFLLDLSPQTTIEPFNAGYKWEGEALVGIPGSDGRYLDVPLTVDQLLLDPMQIVERERLEMAMAIVPPDVTDPEPLLEDARRMTAQPFSLNGYDPFLDRTLAWSTSPDVFASWLEAGQDGLTLRDSTFAQFLEYQNQSLMDPDGTQTRYLDPRETIDIIKQAIGAEQNTVNLRIRYRESIYTVEPGDTASRIARKTGIPFYLIAEANQGRDLNVLFVGDTLNLPSRDRALPLTPVPEKRIVVDLNSQVMVAFENGQEVFRWLISSGMDDAPTSPGIYQILSHNEVASGGSYTLCSANGCESWEMYWFMGMYEVIPGLMNGFHGAVLLPNGNYLGGGNVGQPYTFGCVMSEDGNAEALYNWADLGTVVEIISNEYAPRSELGLAVWNANHPDRQIQLNVT